MIKKSRENCMFYNNEKCCINPKNRIICPEGVAEYCARYIEAFASKVDSQNFELLLLLRQCENVDNFLDNIDELVIVEKRASTARLLSKINIDVSISDLLFGTKRGFSNNCPHEKMVEMLSVFFDEFNKSVAIKLKNDLYDLLTPVQDDIKKQIMAYDIKWPNEKDKV
ncbi:hypothetical protein LCGC14_2377990 [marine sediment metagenome]|uniref:Uncharacterized protein n=1 Tax=marine sediment metagenome TaxID=412755 RepID=A0A0F9EWE9_9ZZZZ